MPSQPSKPTPVVLALVSASRSAKLAAALHPVLAVRDAGNYRALLAPPDLPLAAVVVDPLLLDISIARATAVLRRAGRSVPLVFYIDLSARAIRRLFELRAIPGASLILAGWDDGPEALRRMFVTRDAIAYRLRAAQALLATAGRLPPNVPEALARMLVSEDGELNVARLAELVNVSPRTLERRLARVGAPSGARLVRMARALLARELLASSPLSAAEIARDIGYAKLESLRALTRWSFGSSPSNLRDGGDASDLRVRLSRRRSIGPAE